MSLMNRPDAQRSALVHPVRLAIQSLNPALQWRVIDPEGFLYVSIDCGHRAITEGLGGPVWRAIFRNPELPQYVLRKAAFDGLDGAGYVGRGQWEHMGKLGYYLTRRLSDEEMDFLDGEYRELVDVRQLPAEQKWAWRKKVLESFPFAMKEFADNSLRAEFALAGPALHIPTRGDAR